MTADGLTDVVNHTTMFRDEKRQAEDRISAAKANQTNVIANQRANKKKSIKKKKVRSHVRVRVPVPPPPLSLSNTLSSFFVAGSIELLPRAERQRQALCMDVFYTSKHQG